MSLSDPDLVRREYQSEDGLRSRASVYQGLAGPDAREVVVEAIREAAPRSVLEVGCGWGELAAKVRDEITPEVIAVDLSPRMVELALERGVDARIGDVQSLAFDDASFDCVTANWMLYHAPDIDQAIAELARVLIPGGRLVAATNSARHLEELWALVGRDKTTENRHFMTEDGAQLLGRYFTAIERRDVASEMTFADTESVRGYVASSIAHKHLASRVPALPRGLIARRRCGVFVATKA